MLRSSRSKRQMCTKLMPSKAVQASRICGYSTSLPGSMTSTTTCIKCHALPAVCHCQHLIHAKDVFQARLSASGTSLRYSSNGVHMVSGLAWAGQVQCNVCGVELTGAWLGVMMRYGRASSAREDTDLQSKDNVCCHLQRESGRIGQAFSKPCQQCCTSITARSWP